MMAASDCWLFEDSNMRGRNLCSNTPFNNCEEPTECNANLSVPQFKPGDVAWSRINGTSWWPVQLVDCLDNLKAAKQVKGVTGNDMDSFKASADGLAKGDEMKSAEFKRITRSKTCKARNAGNNEEGVSNEADNASIDPSMINCLNKRDSRNFQHKDNQEKAWLSNE